MTTLLSSAFNRRARPAMFTAASLLVSACAGSSPPAESLATGTAAYKTFPGRSSAAPAEYRIGPLDLLAINVFQEPDLSFKEIQVDASGNLLFPLIGGIRAGGKSPGELAAEIAGKLNVSYLRNAQVTVTVSTSAQQHVTVEGNVTQPGVYDINGSSTLLEAIAKARSPTRVARLDQVIVFRQVNGQREGAVFNLNDIRSGRAPDPQLQGGDLVVVGFSGVKGAFRDFLQSAPLLSVFRPF